MPGVIDKIRINNGDLRGTFLAIEFAMRNAADLNMEIQECGGGAIVGNKWIAEDTAAHLAEQEALCKAVDDAMMTFLVAQRDLNNRRRQWIDVKLSQKP